MKVGICALVLLGLALPIAVPVSAQQATNALTVQGPNAAAGPVLSEKFTTQYIRLGEQGEGLLYKPVNPGAKARIAVVFTHPGNDNFIAPFGPELASRGYMVMNVNYRGNEALGVDFSLPTVSLAVGYMRSLPGVKKVVVTGYSGGSHAMALYENVAEHGAAACNGPEKIYPCKAAGLNELQKPDGVILMDPSLGTFHLMSSIDPAVSTDVYVRDPALDMFSAANGFDAAAGRATYSADFAKRFYAAQSARSMEIVGHALERLKAVEAGKGEFANDEPLVVPGLGVEINGARLYQPDPSFAAHTREPHLLLKADGSRVETIIHSVRPPQPRPAGQVHVLGTMSTETTLRGYLSHAAIRTTGDFAITDDDIVGVDWRSAYDSPPGNAYGISVPSLVLTMGCHYLLVPGELIYDRLAAKDKTYATVEGATHIFEACKPEYGDTTKRTFDFVDEWLSKDGRF